jgi:hypothetical protein
MIAIFGFGCSGRASDKWPNMSLRAFQIGRKFEPEQRYPLTYLKDWTRYEHTRQRF